MCIASFLPSLCTLPMPPTAESFSARCLYAAKLGERVFCKIRPISARSQRLSRAFAREGVLHDYLVLLSSCAYWQNIFQLALLHLSAELVLDGHTYIQCSICLTRVLARFYLRGEVVSVSLCTCVYMRVRVSACECALFTCNGNKN